MTLPHPALVKLLKLAFSAERAAAYAYQGHAASVRAPDEVAAIRQIEADEWRHRDTVGAIMARYEVPASRYYELRFQLVGKVISAACFVIGWFMPFYFAGRLESGNTCEYFRMKHYFNELAIHDHDQMLLEMAIKEKEHEVYFLEKIRHHPLLPLFELVFRWGARRSFNDIDLAQQPSLETAHQYCRK